VAPCLVAVAPSHPQLEALLDDLQRAFYAKPVAPLGARYALLDTFEDVAHGAAKGCEIPNFKGSYFGRFPLVSADFWTSDHLLERSRSTNVVL